MARSMRRSRKNSSSRRSVKRGGGLAPVGNRPASSVSFAAKLGAFLCENEKLSDVVGSDDGFFTKNKGKSVNKRVFGALPFLHLNITKNQFVSLLESGKLNLVNAAKGMCTSAGLESSLKKVKFDCAAQSKVGVSALNLAICESIENRWEIRRNGRAVLNKIQKVQEAQAHPRKAIIPSKSLNWCR
jgi:hypothetical protein